MSAWRGHISKHVMPGTMPGMTIWSEKFRSSVGRRAVDDCPKLSILLAVGGAADELHLLQVVLGLEPVALLCLPHAEVRPGPHVVGIGGERLLVPALRVVVVAKLAVGVADVVRDIGMLVVAERMHCGDAVLVIAAKNQK